MVDCTGHTSLCPHVGDLLRLGRVPQCQVTIHKSQTPMMNVCLQCGTYRADKMIDRAGPYAICPEGGYKHRFLQLPLLIVSGASGAGKSMVYHHLLSRVTQAVLLDSDILWRSEFNAPDANYRDFFETWLRVCKNISQSGRPVVLFGAGVGVPENPLPQQQTRHPQNRQMQSIGNRQRVAVANIAGTAEGAGINAEGQAVIDQQPA